MLSRQCEFDVEIVRGESIVVCKKIMIIFQKSTDPSNLSF